MIQATCNTCDEETEVKGIDESCPGFVVEFHCPSCDSPASITITDSKIELDDGISLTHFLSSTTG